MKILLPSHPIKGHLPDPDFASEAEAAAAVGFDCAFYNLDSLREGDAQAACSKISLAEQNSTFLHRGWMMSDEHYSALFCELKKKGYTLFTNPEQYAEAHYLPNAYPHLAGLTPKTSWIVGKNLDEAWAVYQAFQGEPALIKDFVKSAKHKWKEACYIHAGCDRQQFESIVTAFLQTRGVHFNKGIVLRRFHALITLGHDLRGQPIHEEYRLFFFEGTLLAATPPLNGQGPFTEIEKWSEVANRFQNRFISMDIARQEDGFWIIIEVGDGGVSGLPDSLGAEKFYQALMERNEKDN